MYSQKSTFPLARTITRRATLFNAAGYAEASSVRIAHIPKVPGWSEFIVIGKSYYGRDELVVTTDGITHATYGWSVRASGAAFDRFVKLDAARAATATAAK